MSSRPSAICSTVLRVSVRRSTNAPSRPSFARLRDVGAVRFEQFGAAGADFRGHGAQRAVLGVGAGARKLARRRARGPAQFAHVRRDVN